MSDSFDFFENDDHYISDKDSPFYGLPTGDVPVQQDPSDAIVEEVLDRLGVEDFTGITVDFGNVNVENLRGNRFANLTDAIVYLAEAGIFSFGDVTLDDDGEIGISIGYEDGDR